MWLSKLRENVKRIIEQEGGNTIVKGNFTTLYNLVNLVYYTSQIVPPEIRSHWRKSALFLPCREI
jgi:hypothetical protein